MSDSIITSNNDYDKDNINNFINNFTTDDFNNGSNQDHEQPTNEEMIIPDTELKVYSSLIWTLLTNWEMFQLVVSCMKDIPKKHAHIHMLLIMMLMHVQYNSHHLRCKLIEIFLVFIHMLLIILIMNIHYNSFYV